MITCISCKEDKDLDDYLISDNAVDAVHLSNECRECRNIRNTAALEKFVNDNTSVPVKSKVKLLNKEAFNKLFIKQDGKCVICKTHQSELKRRLSIDHNHDTGKVRGLLCNSCNVSLGLMKENIKTLENMITYIQKNNV